MTVAGLIVELQALPPDAEVVAGEWVSPSQLGVPKVDLSSDYESVTPRVKIFAPCHYQLSETEQASGKYERIF